MKMVNISITTVNEVEFFKFSNLIYWYKYFSYTQILSKMAVVVYGMEGMLWNKDSLILVVNF